VSFLRRRKYPADTTAWLVRFFRNLDQHFHDQTDEGVLSLKTHWMAAGRSGGSVERSDAEFLELIRSKTDKQRELISSYLRSQFPTFILSLWKNVGLAAVSYS